MNTFKGFWCSACNKSVEPDLDGIPEEDKPSYLEMAKERHRRDKHLICQLCCAPISDGDFEYLDELDEDEDEDTEVCRRCYLNRMS